MDETIDGNVTRASDFWTMGPLSRSHASIARHSRTAHDRSARGNTDTPLHFHHRSGGGGGAGQAAKDATGADIKSKVWLKTHLPGDHTLSQGLKVRVAALRRTGRAAALSARGGLACPPFRASEPKRGADRGVPPSEARIRHRSGGPVFSQRSFAVGRAASWHPIACLRRLERANSPPKMFFWRETRCANASVLVFAALRGVSTGDWLSRSASLSLSLLDARFTEQGDATYIVVKDDGSIENYGINAVCTHLGCVVPWNKAENKFKCPCHGSQYNNEGKVIRGPAPLSLALAHAEINDSDTIIFSPWTETDFRTGLQPWWK